MIEPGASVLAAVSGGPDSTCLLIILAALRKSLGFTLHAAHFDHGLRGRRAAAREERFVRGLAEALDVPLQTESGDVRGHASNSRHSIEESARELRYRFLASAAASTGCDIVAAGHTRSDQAETVLLHITRGSGLRGLASMAPSAGWPITGAGRSLRLIRPLLELSRDETAACCDAAGLTPIADPSNQSLAHLRNRVRKELLPMLRTYNPRIEEALSRLANAAADDIELLEQMAAGALVESTTSEPGVVRIDRKVLLSLPPALQRHAVRLAATRLLGDKRGWSERHVRALLLASDGPTGSSLDLPRGVQANVERGRIVLSTRPSVQAEALPEAEVTLSVPGRTLFGPWQFEAKLLSRRPRTLRSNDSLTVFLDARAVGTQLRLRRRRRGDRFHPLGMSESKKLQDFFVDAHVPRTERDRVPLLIAARGIAWVVEQRPAEWAKVTPSTKKVLRISASGAMS